MSLHCVINKQTYLSSSSFVIKNFFPNIFFVKIKYCLLKSLSLSTDEQMKGVGGDTVTANNLIW
jgi:hypothetical protein